MINVTKTYLPDIEKYKSYVDQIYASGWITNNGELVQALEKRLKVYLGIKNIILVSNGTLALQVAYKVLDLAGEVITTPFSFVATTSSLVWEGLKPVFADIDKDTLNIDACKIERAITPHTSCIVPVHVFGNACNIEKISEIAERHSIKVIYDAAHAFGITYKNESILNFGDISILSFHATKIFHTIEGGALVINDDALYEKAKRIINFGIISGGNVTDLGINAKMNEFEAAMGLCILDDMDKIIDRRKKVYEYYVRHLAQLDGLRFQKQTQHCHMNFSYFPVIFKEEEKVMEVMGILQKHGIMPRRYFYPSLDKLPYIQNAPDVPISNTVAKRILCLPIYDSLDIKKQVKIIEVVKEHI